MSDPSVLSTGFIRISTFLEDIPDPKIPPRYNSKVETGMVGLQNQVRGDWAQSFTIDRGGDSWVARRVVNMR